MPPAPSLASRTSRARLAARTAPYWLRLTRGLLLGYRRLPTSKEGTWVAKRLLGRDRYVTEALGLADDLMPADGETILTSAQAMQRCMALREAAGPLTVADACGRYVEFLRAERRTADDAAGRLAKHVLPHIGLIPVAEVTAEQLECVKRLMVSASADPEKVRRSQDSANRVLTSLKAALQRAFDDPGNKIPTDTAWRRVKPFRAVTRPRVAHLTVPEAVRLIEAAPPALALLLEAALLTGARYGELAGLRVQDVDTADGRMTVSGKTGRRSVLLTAEAAQFFAGTIAGRDPSEHVFLRAPGRPWRKSDQSRPMQVAVRAAGLDPSVTVYALRHSHVSRAVEGGVPLTILAQNLGTSVGILERTYTHLLDDAARAWLERGAPSLAAARPQRRPQVVK